MIKTMEYIKKIENLVFYATASLLVLIIFSNLFLIKAHAQLGGTRENGGIQAGGRTVLVTPCTPPPVPNPICVAAGCTPTAGISDLKITPFGYSAMDVCIPSTLLTSGPPLTPTSIGFQVIGFFMNAIPGPAIPLQITGTSL